MTHELMDGIMYLRHSVSPNITEFPSFQLALAWIANGKNYPDSNYRAFDHTMGFTWTNTLSQDDDWQEGELEIGDELDEIDEPDQTGAVNEPSPSPSSLESDFEPPAVQCEPQPGTKRRAEEPEETTNKASRKERSVNRRLKERILRARDWSINSAPHKFKCREDKTVSSHECPKVRENLEKIYGSNATRTMQHCFCPKCKKEKCSSSKGVSSNSGLACVGATTAAFSKGFSLGNMFSLPGAIASFILGYFTGNDSESEEKKEVDEEALKIAMTGFVAALYKLVDGKNLTRCKKFYGGCAWCPVRDCEVPAEESNFTIFGFN